MGDDRRFLWLLGRSFGSPWALGCAFSLLWLRCLRLSALGGLTRLLTLASPALPPRGFLTEWKNEYSKGQQYA